ncbi:MAG: RNA polymerase sigma factor [Candidatus Limnocylindria bacterium]
MPDDRLEELFEAHHRALLTYAARRCPTLADAEDVVADVFLVAWRRLNEVPDGDAARLWLYGVARRTIGNQRRGLTRRVRLQARLEQTAERPMPTTPVDIEPALEALARMSAADQELLRLVAWEELSHAEIAEVLGISVNAVAIRLHRARSRFEQAMVKGPSRWRTWPWVKGSLSRRPTREEP